MILQVDVDFQRKLDQFNAAKGPPSKIEVAWDSKMDRWRVYAVPISDSMHPKARNGITKQLLRKMPDGSGRWGIPLFVLAQRDDRGVDVGFMPLDDRLFDALNYADTFRSKRHFEETVKQPEIAAEAAKSARAMDALKAARSYWWGLDNLTISYSKSSPSGGDWRWRVR